MGLTWIFGVLIVEVDALLPLAYIYTILVAFQGLWIFLIFVAFPRQVRDEYFKLWTTKIKGSSDKYTIARVVSIIQDISTYDNSFLMQTSGQHALKNISNKFGAVMTTGKHKVHIELKSFRPLHSVVIENTVVLENQKTVVTVGREEDTCGYIHDV